MFKSEFELSFLGYRRWFKVARRAKDGLGGFYTSLLLLICDKPVMISGVLFTSFTSKSTLVSDSSTARYGGRNLLYDRSTELIRGTFCFEIEED
jgi:hypothetical protein